MAGIVGRAAELADIDRALADATAGHGRLVLISGPAGIGKTRLAEAAATSAAAKNVAVARGYAVDDPGAPALWPWLRLMRGWPGAERLPTADTGEPDAAARFRLFMAVSDLIGARAANPASAGLLLVLEDMHWADRTSIRLLGHLVAELATARVAIVVTGRDGVAGPLLDALPELVRGDATRTLELAALSAAEVAAWLPALAGAADGQLAAALHERTGGNPLLVRLVAENLAGGGRAGSAESLERLMSERPQLRRLVAGRVDELPPAVRALVDAASALGERIAPDVLAAMTGAPLADVRTGLDAALSSGILVRDDATGGTRFRHALVRDAVYAELSGTARSELHRRAAAALERTRPHDAAGSIAHHWHGADGPDAVAHCLVWAQRADDQARAVLAFDDATRFARLAVSCARAGGADDGELAGLLVRLAEAQFLANRVADSIATCVEAAERAGTAGRPDLLAAAALVVHGIGDPFANRTIPALCERALVALPDDEHVTRARLLAQIAVGRVESDAGPEAAELAAAALAEAERSGDPAAILEAIAARHLAITIPPLVEERLELGRRAVELGTTMQQPAAALWGHLWRVDAAFQLGNLAEADRELRHIDRVARERGSALARWHHHRYLAVRHVLVGELDAARAENEASRVLGRRMGDLAAEGMYYAFQVQMCWLCADSNEVAPGWDRMMAQAPPIPLVRISTPLVHACAGRLDQARAEFDEFRHVPRTLPVGTRWTATVNQIGITAVLLGDVEVCADVHDLVAPFAHYYCGDGSGGVFTHGSNALLAGDLARVAGRPDEAIAHYRDAVAMDVRIGARPFTALSRLGWAQALLVRGDGAELSEAAELATGAAAEFRRLDLPGRLAAAAQVIETIEAARRTASPLSTRESEVAVLVADALSNREIAARLVLSERTVESHVRSILAKLGFTTRTEIATWSVRERAR